ncbi:hypothetical protein, partial [Avibacterium avium]|uniref:hypothetical protein n=2 Tax=Pasteurellaceae TaxID=712 RepID=UPI003BF89BDD
MEKEKKTTVGTFTQDPTKSIVKVQITRRIPDGVYIFTETVMFGHAFVLISSNNQMTSYSYGRYGEQDTSQGILFRYKGELCKKYAMKELYRFNANVYKILDVTPEKVSDTFEKIWLSSTQPAKSKMPDSYNSGRVIDEYKLTSRNCTTVTINALQKSGTNIFKDNMLIERCKYVPSNFYDKSIYFLDDLDCINPEEDRFFIDPEDLEDYLEKISKENYCVINFSK